MTTLMKDIQNHPYNATDRAYHAQAVVEILRRIASEDGTGDPHEYRLLTAAFDALDECTDQIDRLERVLKGLEAAA